MIFNFELIMPTEDYNFPINGSLNMLLTGKRYIVISVPDDGCKYTMEIDFDGSTSYSLNDDFCDCSFSLVLDLLDFEPLFCFKPQLLEDRCFFSIDKNFMDSFYTNNSGSSNTFNFLDLNGNCGTFKNNTVVNVLGKTGDYIVKWSQFVWDDTTKKSSMVVYYLEKDGTFMSVPDVLVSLKVAP